MYLKKQTFNFFLISVRHLRGFQQLLCLSASKFKTPCRPWCFFIKCINSISQCDWSLTNSLILAEILHNYRKEAYFMQNMNNNLRTLYNLLWLSKSKLSTTAWSNASNKACLSTTAINFPALLVSLVCF